MTVIYGLHDPETGALRYVGKANCPNARIKAHMRDSRCRNTPVYCWIRKVGEPRITVLEDCGENWVEAERRIIADARARGERLLNVADGGDEPFCSTEVRSRNARKATAARSDILWRLYRRCGQQKSWAKKAGNNELAAKVQYAVDRMKAAETRARKGGTLDALEARVLPLLRLTPDDFTAIRVPHGKAA